MKGYILRWNPNISSWTYDRHEGLMKALNNGEEITMNWSIYDFEDLEEGDFFIVQQVGTESDGIVMVGTFCSEPYTETSWKKKDGTNLFYADMNIDLMIDRNKLKVIPEPGDKPLFSAEELEVQFPEIEWHKGHSGVLIPEDLLEPLILEICRRLFACKDSSEAVAFTDADWLWESACRYINDFCPAMRKQISNESKDRMIYENYEEGETVDEDLLDIIFDAEKLSKEDVDLTDFPKFLVPRA